MTDQPKRRYFTQLPNMIDDLGLSPFAFRLYVHIKRVTGETGECHQGTRTLAEACKMSMGSVSAARAELKAANLITLEYTHNPHGGKNFITMRPVDIWEENHTEYQPSSPHELASSQGEQWTVTSSLTELASSPSEIASSPHEIKNNPLRITHEEEQVIKEEEEEEKPAAADFSPRTPLNLFTAITGMLTYPQRADWEKADITIKGVLDSVGWDTAFATGKQAYEMWLKCRNDRGSFYPKTHLGWLDWLVSGDIPAEPIDNSKRKNGNGNGAKPMLAESNRAAMAEAMAIMEGRKKHDPNKR